MCLPFSLDPSAKSSQTLLPQGPWQSQADRITDLGLTDLACSLWLGLRKGEIMWVRGNVRRAKEQVPHSRFSTSATSHAWQDFGYLPNLYFLSPSGF